MQEDKFNYSSYYRPLSPWAYVGYSILFCLPVIGIIFLIVFCFNNDNINRKNYARSYLCWLLIIAILSAILLYTGLAPALSRQIRGLQYFS